MSTVKHFRQGVSPPGSVEARAAERIDRGIATAREKGRLVDHQTARLIAAALHQGIDGELVGFAGSGRLVRHQVARLELHYAVKGEPQFAIWAEALRRFITADQRRHGSHGAPSAGKVVSR